MIMFPPVAADAPMGAVASPPAAAPATAAPATRRMSRRLCRVSSAFLSVSVSTADFFDDRDMFILLLHVRVIRALAMGARGQLTLWGLVCRRHVGCPLLL